MPGRIVGETVDTEGKRGFVLTLQTREQHIRREKATSNITTNQTLLALGGLVYLTWLGPQGLREVGEACLGLAELREAAAARAPAFELAFDHPTFKEFAIRVGRNAREVIRDARALGVHPGLLRSARDYEGMDDVLLVAVTEKRTPRRDRPARRGARGGGGMTSSSTSARSPAAARRRPALRRGCRRPRCPEELRRAEPPRLPEVAELELVRHFTELSSRNFCDRHGLLPARLLHDEVQPEDQRAARGAARVRVPSPAAGGATARRARSS